MPRPEPGERIKTSKGRVVYERKRNQFTPRDLKRIARSLIESAEKSEQKEISAIFLGSFIETRLRLVNLDADLDAIIKLSSVVLVAADLAADVLNWEYYTATDVISFIINVLVNGFNSIIGGKDSGNAS